MYLSDDILKAITKSKGNFNLLARLVLQNGDDFAKAIINTQLLDDFCDLARMYGDDVAKVMACGDDAISFISKYEDASDLIKCFKNENVNGIEKLSNAKGSTVFTFSTAKNGETYVAGSGVYEYNPTISVPDGYIVLENNSEYYVSKYNQLLTKDYINSMTNINESTRIELLKLSDAIEYTRTQAQLAGKYNYGKLYSLGYDDFSFYSNRSVINCGEVWSAREAILNGATFEELSFQSIYSSNGVSIPMCENCRHTFIEYLKSLGEVL